MKIILLGFRVYMKCFGGIKMNRKTIPSNTKSIKPATTIPVVDSSLCIADIFPYFYLPLKQNIPVLLFR